MRGKRAGVYLLAVTFVAGLFAPAAWSQKMDKYYRDCLLEMLDNISKEVQKNYYDPKLHGVDWDGRVAEAKSEIKQQNSIGMALNYIAWVLDGLNDTHTFFIPPQGPARHDYGFRTAMVGDHCYVTGVRPGSDAEAKGVRLGDEVLVMDGHVPDRQVLRELGYRLSVLRPQPELRLGIRDSAGHGREVVVSAKIVEHQQVTGLDAATGGMDFWNLIRKSQEERHRTGIRTASVGNELLVAKLPGFFFDQSEVDALVDKARKNQTLIVDLRGNPGGTIETLKYLLGGLFENEVKIGDRSGRKELKPEVAKPRGRSTFAGKLVVLVDSQSASAAELFARIVQLEKRGMVIGDRSSGSVMEARRYSYKAGSQYVIFYGASITESDLIMTDGKSLEHNGVTPDEVLLPSAADLASGRDPVLAYAASRVGVKLTPEDAGKMFPYEWPKE
ncbi:MAG TPA: S41 family peptidase [Terriglobia bacterium]|nr:S41 family peptidase [Terriglobia bacterium]